MSEMMSRMQQGPTPLRQLDGTIPPAVERVVARCLESLPEKRFQTTQELVQALDALTPDGHPLTTAAPKPRSFLMPAAIAVALVAALAAGWFAWSARTPAAPAGQPQPVSVLIANFDNPSGDPLLDGLVEQALAVGVEGASFVSAYPRRDALRAMERIRPGAPLTEANARLLAISEGIDRVVAGSIASGSGGYRLAVRVVDPGNGKAVLDWDTDAAGKDQVLNAVGRAAARVRNALGDQDADPSNTSAQETFTAASLEAAHAYVQAQDLQWGGKYEDALAKYQEAVRLDPELGRAYAGMGAVSSSLGRRTEAEGYYKKALELSNRMTDRERYRTRSGYYLLIHDTRKAGDELQALISRFPADSAGLTNLALVKFLERDMKAAMDLGGKAAAVYPKNVLRRNNYALYAMYGGDFATAQKEAANVLQINPGFAKAYVATALSQIATGDTAGAGQTYQKLAAVSATGADFAALGGADLAMYEGRLADAGTRLAQGIASAPAGRSATVAARLQVTLAEVHALQQNGPQAIKAAESALAAAPQDVGISFLAGRALLAAGQRSRALEIAGALGGRIDDEPRMYARLLEGEVELAAGRAVEALARLNEAQDIADSWIGRFDLGRVYLLAGKFAEADSEFDRCITRRGEATAALLDDIPTYRWLAPVYYYSGLAKEGLKAGGADAFKTFLMIKQNGDEQGIVADARRRLNP
jgi:tetratricopeptide (TPR) repeat protein